MRKHEADDRTPDCRSCDDWLDGGMPPERADAAREHAARCARCARALEAACALEALLAAPPAALSRAPEGFTERVMLRVDRAQAARVWIQPMAQLDAMPWWSRAALQPTVLLAAAIAAVIGWRPAALGEAGTLAAHAVLRAWDGLRAGAGAVAANVAGERASTPAGDPLFELGLAVTLATVLAFAALPLYRWTERLAQGPRRLRPH